MNGQLSGHLPGRSGQSPLDRNSDLLSVTSEKTGRPSAKSLYEQRKNYARDTVSVISETSRYHVEASSIQQDIDSAVNDSKGGRGRPRPDVLRNIAVNEKVLPPPQAVAPHPPGSVTQVDVQSRVAAWSAWAAEYGDYDRGLQGAGSQETPQMTEARIDRDVQILNHILDDIEFFITKLQKAAEAFSELCKRRKSKKKKGPGEGVLTLRAQPPAQEEFVDCFQKFKHGFNLLAKLKSQIQNPSAAELVHFLFTPLNMIVEATGDSQLASTVLSPLLMKDAIDFLHFVLNSKEKQLWLSLGDTWTKSRMEWPKDQFIPPYIPRFRNGWEPPLLPLLEVPKELERNHFPESADLQHIGDSRNVSNEYIQGPSYPQPYRNAEEQSAEQSAEPSRKCAICKYDFVARNCNELSVVKEDVVEVLEDQKQWWKVRNAEGASGFVPNNILSVMKAEETSVGCSGHIYRQTIQKQKSELSQRPLVPSPPPSSAPVPPLISLPTSKSYPLGKQSSSSGDMEGMRPDRRKSQMEEVQDELVHRLTIGRSTAQKKFTVPRQNALEANISYSSSTEEVKTWLLAKGFNSVTITSLGVLTGAQLFSLTKDELMTVCPEGPRVYNQVTLQKANLEELNGSSELQEIMRKRQEKMNTGASDSGVDSFDEGNNH